MRFLDCNSPTSIVSLLVNTTVLGEHIGQLRMHAILVFEFFLEYVIDGTTEESNS